MQTHKWLFCVVVTGALLSCWSGTTSIKPSPAYVAYFPLRLEMAEARMVSEKRQTTYITRSIPPRSGYKIIGYVYEIQLFITVIGDSIFYDQHFGVACEKPGGELEIIGLNANEGLMESGVLHEFRFTMDVETKGSLRLSLVEYDPAEQDYFVVDEFSPFLNKTVALR